MTTPLSFRGAIATKNLCLGSGSFASLWMTTPLSFRGACDEESLSWVKILRFAYRSNEIAQNQRFWQFLLFGTGWMTSKFRQDDIFIFCRISLCFFSPRSYSILSSFDLTTNLGTLCGLSSTR